MSTEPTINFETTTSVRLETFLDPAQTSGHHPRSTYVERFWLPVLGPSTIVLVRQLAQRISEGEREVDLAVLARTLGLGDSTQRERGFHRTLRRALDFDVLRYTAARTLGLRALLPTLSVRQVEHLPETLRTEHRSLGPEGSRTSRSRDEIANVRPLFPASGARHPATHLTGAPPGHPGTVKDARR
jgi:hypothetical protein